jgi:hypothetical protein
VVWVWDLTGWVLIEEVWMEYACGFLMGCGAECLSYIEEGVDVIMSLHLFDAC